MGTIIEQTQQDLARAEYARSTQASYLRTIKLFLSRQERPIEEVGRG